MEFMSDSFLYCYYIRAIIICVYEWVYAMHKDTWSAHWLWCYWSAHRTLNSPVFPSFNRVCNALTLTPFTCQIDMWTQMDFFFFRFLFSAYVDVCVCVCVFHRSLVYSISLVPFFERLRYSEANLVYAFCSLCCTWISFSNFTRLHEKTMK